MAARLFQPYAVLMTVHGDLFLMGSDRACEGAAPLAWPFASLVDQSVPPPVARTGTAIPPPLNVSQPAVGVLPRRSVLSRGRVRLPFRPRFLAIAAVLLMAARLWRPRALPALHAHLRIRCARHRRHRDRLQPRRGLGDGDAGAGGNAGGGRPGRGPHRRPRGQAPRRRLAHADRERPGRARPAAGRAAPQREPGRCADAHAHVHGHGAREGAGRAQVRPRPRAARTRAQLVAVRASRGRRAPAPAVPGRRRPSSKARSCSSRRNTSRPKAASTRRGSSSTGWA